MKLVIDNGGQAVQVLRPIRTQTLSISGTAASASAFTEFSSSSNFAVVRIVSTVTCFYTLSGTATTSKNYLPADQVEYIKAAKGDVLSIITSGASGTMYVAECD